MIFAFIVVHRVMDMVVNMVNLILWMQEAMG